MTSSSSNGSALKDDDLVERWDAIEERERKIESMRGARRRGRWSTVWPEAPTLVKDLQAERFVSSAELRDLATRTYSQPVISVYLNLTPDRAGRGPGAYLTLFNSMRHRELAARQELIDHLSTQQRSALRSDLDEIEDLLRTVNLFRARSLVVFKSGELLNRVVRLPVRTADSLTIEADPYVEALEAVLEEHLPVLVVEVAKEESRFWSQHLGHLEEIESLDAFVPTDTVDAGRPGKVQRHRLTHLRWHLKTAADLAGRLFTERGFSLLILSGERRVLAEFERFLPDWLGGKVAGRLHPGPQQDRAEWERQIEGVLLEHRRAEEEAALARLADCLGSGLVRSGLVRVLEVVNQFLVRRLFVSVELKQAGYVCREHHFLSLQGGRCPFFGADLLPAENIVDELVEFARLHGVELTVMEERPELLDPYAGVAGVMYDLSAA